MYNNKQKKLCSLLLTFVKLFVKVPWNVLEWMMRKNGISYVWVKLVMALYEGAMTRVIVDSELSEELEVKIVTVYLCCHFFCGYGRYCHHLAYEGVLSELLYADDLPLMSEAID